MLAAAGFRDIMSKKGKGAHLYHPFARTVAFS